MSNGIKILYLITQADGGGAQKYVLTMAKHFNGIIAAGSEANKLFDDAKNLPASPAGKQLTTYNLTHLRRNIHPWHDFFAVWEIRKLIKTVLPDIVHLNSTKAGFLGSIAAIGLNTKVIFTAHGFRFLEPLSPVTKWFYKLLEKIASHFRDYIIAVSNRDMEAAIKNKIISKKKISVVYNGIEKIDFLTKVDARKKLGLPLNKKIIGIIANDYKTKGLDIIEKAIQTKPLTNMLLVIVGKTLTQKKSTEQIRYLGYIPNAASYLKAFDGTAIPSRKEGFPYIALEAMQAGQPIIANKVGGLSEALDNAAILVEPDETGAQFIMEMGLLDNQKSTELSQKALKRSNLFTEEKMLKETKEIYTLVLTQLRQPRKSYYT